MGWNGEAAGQRFIWKGVVQERVVRSWVVAGKHMDVAQHHLHAWEPFGLFVECALGCREA